MPVPCTSAPDAHSDRMRQNGAEIYIRPAATPHTHFLSTTSALPLYGTASCKHFTHQIANSTCKPKSPDPPSMESSGSMQSPDKAIGNIFKMKSAILSPGTTAAVSGINNRAASTAAAAAGCLPAPHSTQPDIFNSINHCWASKVGQGDAELPPAGAATGLTLKLTPEMHVVCPSCWWLIKYHRESIGADNCNRKQ